MAIGTVLIGIPIQFLSHFSPPSAFIVSEGRNVADPVHIPHYSGIALPYMARRIWVHRLSVQSLLERKDKSKDRCSNRSTPRKHLVVQWVTVTTSYSTNSSIQPISSIEIYLDLSTTSDSTYRKVSSFTLTHIPHNGTSVLRIEESEREFSRLSLSFIHSL